MSEKPAETAGDRAGEHPGKHPVVHLLRTYLPRSQTFIYNCLRHMRRHRPIVLAERRENEDTFPIDDIVFLPEQARWRAYGDKILRRLIQRQWLIEPAYDAALRAASPRVIHAHFGLSGVFALPHARDLAIPLLTSFHGADVYRTPRHLAWRLGYRRLFRSSWSSFTVVSKRMKQDLVDLGLGCDPERLHVIHVGVDVEHIRFRPRRLENAQGEVQVLFCGRLVEKKGLEYALRAFAQVVRQRSRSDVSLRVAGDGDLRPQMETLAQRLGIAGRVHFLGWQPPSAVIGEMQRAQLFLLPSVTARNGDREGIPSVLMEAQASGMPVLSTWHSGIPEVVLHEESGLLVPERDVEALATALNWLLNHPERWPEMGARGRRHVEDAFNLRREVERLEVLYENLWRGLPGRL
jgi:colanic acid/amylovoran biosynthesis glycosyltransferase